MTGPDDVAAAVFAAVAAEAEELGPAAGAFPPGPGPGPAAALRDGIAAALHLFTDTVLQIVDGVVEAAAPDEGGPLRLPVRPGPAATTPVWMHNLTAAAVTGSVPRLTRFTADDGGELPGVDATFEPAKLDLAAGASARLALTVRVAAPAPPGVYVGHIVASGLPGTALAVHLVVEP